MALVAACGGGGGDSRSPAYRTGYFIDSAVGGIEYNSGTVSGVTGSDGSFQYQEGQPVTFKIGSMTLGSLTVSNGRVFPVDLVSGATDENNPNVTLIAQVLQSLDSDGDPSNGITISESTRKAITQSVQLATVDATQAASTFAQQLSTATGGTVSMVSAATAKSHLQSNLIKEFAATRTGSYKGEDSGPCQVTIATTGQLSGSCTSTALASSFNVTGTVASNGQFTQGQVSTGAVFTGTLMRNGSVSGTWSNSQYNNITGTWTMTKQ